MAISERKMFELWRKRQSMKAKAAELAEKYGKIDKAIIAEFNRRGIKQLTDAETGVRITKSQAEPVVIDPDELSRRLRRSANGRAILERCTVKQLDMKAIAAEQQAGNIPIAVISACSEIKPSKPYLQEGGGQ